MFSWLTDAGWKPALSSSGLLAKQMYRALDGQPFAIHHPELLGLLERMNGGLVKDNLEPVEDNKLTQERDMPVAELKKRVQSFGGHGDLYEYLLKKRILRLGLRVQCPHCTRHSWFPLDAVRDTFSCPRCLNEYGGSQHRYQVASRLELKRLAVLVLREHNDGGLRPAVRLLGRCGELGDLGAVDPGHLWMQQQGGSSAAASRPSAPHARSAGYASRRFDIPWRLTAIVATWD